MAKCIVPDCPDAGKEFKDNAGLASHMNIRHGLSRDGKPLPADYLEKRKQRIRAGQERRLRVAKAGAKKTVLPMHRPEARIKANAGIRAAIARKKQAKQQLIARVDDATGIHDSSAYYAKLAEKGIYRCPECRQIDHKTYDLPSPKELGKHRRFKHGVLGRHSKKNLAAVAARREITEANQTSDGRVQCPHCPKTLKNEHGLSIHLNRFHPNISTALTLQPPADIVHANGNGHGTIHLPINSGRDHSRDMALATARAMDVLDIHFERNLLALAHEHNLPPRDLAIQWLFHTSGRYSAQ